MVFVTNEQLIIFMFYLLFPIQDSFSVDSHLDTARLYNNYGYCIRDGDLEEHMTAKKSSLNLVYSTQISKFANRESQIANIKN